MAPEIIYKMVV